jgi:hypothetical protein
MIPVEDEDFGYESWQEWARDRTGQLEYFDRVLPQMKFLEERGYLAFPEEFDVSSSADIESILDGEYRWEDREENEQEAMLLAYNLPIELSSAEDEFLDQAGLLDGVSYLRAKRQNAGMTGEGISGPYR